MGFIKQLEAAAPFALGFGMLMNAWHPYVGVSLMLLGFVLFLHAIFTLPFVVRLADPMLRFVFAVLFGSVVVGLSWPSIEERLPNPERETWERLRSPVPTMPPPRDGFEMVPETTFTLINDGPLDIGENTVSCDLTFVGLDHEVREFPAMPMHHDSQLRSGGGLVSFTCFNFAKHMFGKIMDIQCADVRIRIHYVLLDQSKSYHKDFRFLAASGAWSAVDVGQRESFCGPEGVTGLGPGPS